MAWATGNFYHTFADLTIPGRGVPLAFTHTYNSLAASQPGLPSYGPGGPLGDGWTDSYNLALTTDSSGEITVTQPGGASFAYTPTVPGATTYQQ